MEMIGNAIANDPSPPPRPIAGSVGSRIRLIFGATASNWLLLLNEDDGNKEWQTVHMSYMPNDVETQMDNCSNSDRYVTEVAVGPTGAWYIHGIRRDNTEGHSWWGETKAFSGIETNDQLKVSFGSDSDGRETYALLFGRNECVLSSNLPEDLKQRIEHLKSQNKAIKFIRLFAHHGYYISDDEGTDWGNLKTFFLGGELSGDDKGEDSDVEDVVLATNGEWVVIHSDRFESTTKVDASLVDLLKKFYHRQKRRVRRQEKKICEAVEKEKAKEEAEKLTRAGKIKEILESKLLEEVESICELDEHVKKQKRLLQDSIKQLPESQRVRYEMIISKRFS